MPTIEKTADPENPKLVIDGEVDPAFANLRKST